MEEGFAVGVDIGGTKIECALIDHSGHVVVQMKRPTDVSGGYTAVLMQIIEYVRELIYDSKEPILGIGVGVAGQVDAETGMVISAGNLKWENVPLKADLTAVLSPKVFITNDVRAATWGEWRYGAGRGSSQLVCVFVGTGIGGGVVCNGTMLNGFGNTAGEIGHIIIEIDGPQCTCGNYGCLEALASGWAIAKITKDIVKNDPDRGAYILKLVDDHIDAITSYQVIEAFRANDPLAKEVIAGVVKALVAGLTGVVNISNPQRIILGGGVLEGCPELLDFIVDGVRKMSLKVATGIVEIVSSQLHNSAGVIGAASLVINDIEKNRG